MTDETNMEQETLDQIVGRVQGLGEAIRKIGDGREGDVYVTLAVLDSAKGLPPETLAPLYAGVGQQVANEIGKYDKNTVVHSHLVRLYGAVMSKAGEYGPLSE